MNRDESLTIVAMIVSSWPGKDWDSATCDAYAHNIESLDAEHTTNAVAAAVKTMRYRPSIADLREFVRIQTRLSEPDEARFMPVDKPLKPLWVERWQRARHAGDWRCFPEQLVGMDDMARETPEHYRVYAPPSAPLSDNSFWVQGDEYLEGPVPQFPTL